MPIPIRIRVGDLTLEGHLFDSPGAEEIARALPFDASPHRWGDEFYFEIPVDLPLDDTATTQVEVGDIGYWPPGRAIAIFFGPTPASRDDRPVPASAVNRIGHLAGDVRSLARVKGGSRIRMERA